MKNPILLLSCFLFPIASFSQKNYWQQEVNYSIDVSLNDKDNTLNAFEKIEYINHSPDTLFYIWFHIWPNAYKNDKTAFSDQLLINGNTKFYFSDKDQKGYINRLDFKVNNITAQTQDHPNYIDIIKLILPVPLPPGEKISITTPFHEKLSYNFSRGGHDGQSYQVTQWYPKPAVYDSKGWHPIPYLDQGEFYSEFGSFDVSITVPANYVVAATGELQNAEEKEWLKSRSSFTWEPIRRKVKTKSGPMKTVIDPYPPSSTDIKILRFKQDHIHDFAWFADKRFIVSHDTCHLTSGKVIDVFTYFTPPQKEVWRYSIQFAKDAIHHYSALVGEYPYSIVSAVQGPASFGGGMEYPTITIISPEQSPRQLDYTMAHEIGHNWFYGILASNERDHPWMDEGINSYYEALYSIKKNKHFNQDEDKRELDTYIAEKKDQPIETKSDAFSETNYNSIAYYKTAQWMAWLETYLGEETFNKAMHEYFRQWQFRHPMPEDFKKVMEDVSGKNLDSAFSLLNKKGRLPGPEPKGFSAWNPVGANMGYHRKKTVITALPIPGFNQYDKFMIGTLITNLRLPPNHFQFLLAPMYATGSKKFAGIGLINESLYPDGGLFRKIDVGINASTFSYDEFPKMNGDKINFSFTKIAPGIKLTFRQKDARSMRNKFIQWKTYFFNEQTYGRISYDSVFNPPDTTITQIVPVISHDRILNQLRLVIEDYRALYPYRGELKFEQQKDFMRADFTGKYFFNYAKAGGLDVRLFAGKFFYPGSKTDNKKFNTDRYQLNMTGANGYEDYTYSDYFVGRNKFEGASSQQIMVRDGGFKVRTDLLGEKVGKTDDWLMAVNLSSSIPKSINPLSFLPFDIPLKVFVDVGTYADAWKRNSTLDRFLFDAGIHIPILKETVNIYVPLLYSKVFKDYFLSTVPKKNRLFRIMSFSIDISNFSLRKFDRKFDF